MATVLAVNDIWRVRIACYTPDQASVNVLHYKVIGTAGAGATDQDLADRVNTLAAPLYKAVLSVSATYRGTSAQRIFPGPLTAAAFSVGSAGIGTVAGEPLPTQCAGIISLHTSLAGRRQRGRIYLPFPGEDSSTNPGVPTGAYVTAAQTLANALFTTIVAGVGGNTSNLDPVIFHRSTNTADVITRKEAKTAWATQRRRGYYGQKNLPPF